MSCYSKHIIFLQAAHTETDERVLHHQARTLEEEGHIVEIYGIDSISEFQPKQADIYIVDTPKALWRIRHISAKIVYDITEWYPSKKNLRNIRFGKITKAIILIIANLWAGWRCSAFIFGEVDKAKPFRILFPRKRYILLPYYPDLAYIHPRPTNDITKECRILYAGALTKEKGWNRVIATMEHIAKQMPETLFRLDIITKDNLAYSPLHNNLSISKYDFMPFEQFCQQIVNYDLFLDLRDIDIENTRCLPIKLFYYLACGRPSIYSNLSAIEKGIPEINQCAKLINNHKEAVNALAAYIYNKNLYQKQCDNALYMARNKYNWDKIKQHLIQLIHDI